MISLNVQKVTKKYGKITAIQDMSFVLHPGVYGIIGPNGAGKSTLLRMITTNLTQYQKFTILTPGTLTDFLSVVRSQKLPLSQLRTLITVRLYPLKLIQPVCTVLF